MNRKALVIGAVGGESHEESVRSYFLASAPVGWTCGIALVGAGSPAGNIVTYQISVAGCVQYAIDNGYDIIVRSYQGVYSNKLEWDYATANGILVVHAHGLNAHTRLTNPPRLFSAVVVGGGNLANQLSYGPGLELFDLPADSNLGESWSTPTAAGRMAKFFDDHPTYTLWDARQHLRQASSLYATGWIEDGGYGRASSAAVASLDLAPPLELRAVRGIDGQSVTLYWENFASSRWAKTRITKADGTIIYQGTGTSYSWSSDVVGPQTFFAYSEDSNGELSPLEPYAQVIVTGLKLQPTPSAEIAPSYSGYCSQAGSQDGDLAPARISVDQLRQLTSEDGDLVNQRVVDDVIRDADVLIDSYCATKYVVPFSPIPGRVRSLSADLAVYNLFKRRAASFAGGEIPRSYRSLFDDAVSFLKDVAAGRAVIDGAISPAPNAARTQGYTSSSPRVFSGRSLKGL